MKEIMPVLLIILFMVADICILLYGTNEAEFTEGIIAKIQGKDGRAASCFNKEAVI